MLMVMFNRRAILRKWKSLHGKDATYGELLRVCCEKQQGSMADKVCEVLEARVEAMTVVVYGECK